MNIIINGAMPYCRYIEMKRFSSLPTMHHANTSKIHIKIAKK